MAKTKINISLTGSTVNEIDKRGKERSPIIDRDLRRYYESLTERRAVLREKFSIAEIQEVALYWIENECTAAAQILNIHGLLKSKLLKLSFLDVLALVDAIERFWLREGDEDNFAQLLCEDRTRQATA